MKFSLHCSAAENSNFITSKQLVSLIVISVIFSILSAMPVCAQNGKKTIKLARAINPQLKFTEVKVEQQDRKFDESFDAEAEWVKSISFKLENISGKPIVYLQINVNFPETRLTGNLMSYGITFGQRPDSKLKVSNPNEPMLLMSGKTLEVSLENEKDKIYKFLNERQPVKSFQEVELGIGFIIFQDKTAWSAGTFMRQDPNNPDRYNPIEGEQPR